MIRRLLGTAVGILAAFAIMLVLEAVGEAAFPVSHELDAADLASLAAWMASVPLPAKLIVATGWFVGTFGGAWLALRIDDWRWSAWLVVTAVLVGSVANLVQLPHPLWMQVGAIVLPLAGGWLAQRLHRKPYPGEPLLG